jgi:predicted metal-dependent hydrolase
MLPPILNALEIKTWNIVEAHDHLSEAILSMMFSFVSSSSKYLQGEAIRMLFKVSLLLTLPAGPAFLV